MEHKIVIWNNFLNRTKRRNIRYFYKNNYKNKNGTAYRLADLCRNEQIRS
jgi:hypothetical protein